LAFGFHAGDVFLNRRIDGDHAAGHEDFAVRRLDRFPPSGCCGLAPVWWRGSEFLDQAASFIRSSWRRS
jgi:hypothetical protein